MGQVAPNPMYELERQQVHIQNHAKGKTCFDDRKDRSVVGKGVRVKFADVRVFPAV